MLGKRGWTSILLTMLALVWGAGCGGGDGRQAKNGQGDGNGSDGSHQAEQHDADGHDAEEQTGDQKEDEETTDGSDRQDGNTSAERDVAVMVDPDLEPARVEDLRQKLAAIRGVEPQEVESFSSDRKLEIVVPGVKDIQAFADEIDFATVKRVDDAFGEIHVELEKTTEPKPDDAGKE